MWTWSRNHGGTFKRLLEAVGFERETSAEGDVYALKRTDPGLLWLGRSALADLVAP